MPLLVNRFKVFSHACVRTGVKPSSCACAYITPLPPYLAGADNLQSLRNRHSLPGMPAGGSYALTCVSPSFLTSRLKQHVLRWRPLVLSSLVRSRHRVRTVGLLSLQELSVWSPRPESSMAAPRPQWLVSPVKHGSGLQVMVYSFFLPWCLVVGPSRLFGCGWWFRGDSRVGLCGGTTPCHLPAPLDRSGVLSPPQLKLAAREGSPHSCRHILGQLWLMYELVWLSPWELLQSSLGVTCPDWSLGGSPLVALLGCGSLWCLM